MKRLLTALAVLLLLAPPAAGQDPIPPYEFAKGLAAYERGDYRTALDEFRPLAEQGYAPAQGYLGLIYVKGQGVPQDYAVAAKWFRKAARQGNSEAQRELATMHARGKGARQDYAEARKWYRKAADQGDPVSQYGLGVLYVQGKGVPQDYVQAHKWFNLAAAHGHENAANGRELAAQRMTPEQIAEAQELAREWTEEHGE